MHLATDHRTLRKDKAGRRPVNCHVRLISRLKVLSEHVLMNPPFCQFGRHHHVEYSSSQTPVSPLEIRRVCSRQQPRRPCGRQLPARALQLHGQLLHLQVQPVYRAALPSPIARSQHRTPVSRSPAIEIISVTLQPF